MKRIISLILIAACLVLCLVGCANPKKSYKKLEEHINERGTAAHGVYTLELGKNTEGDGAQYIRTATKNATTITLTLNMIEDGTELYTFSLILTKGSHKTVKWEYESAAGDKMAGVITPKEYLRGAYKLNYLTSNINDAIKIDSASGLAKSLCNYLLDKLESDLDTLELTAVDFGFKDFKKK